MDGISNETRMQLSFLALVECCKDNFILVLHIGYHTRYNHSPNATRYRITQDSQNRYVEGIISKPKPKPNIR